MAELPSATTRVNDTSGGLATGTDLITVLSPTLTHADLTPRVWSSIADLLAYHGYCQGVDYAAIHVEATKKPVLFVALPITTAGTVGRFDNSGNSGTSVVTCAVAAGGALDETDGILAVKSGGTIGTDQIVLSLSLDRGRTYKDVRLGTASSYTIPYVGLVLSFAGGDLHDDDIVLTWHSTAPKPSSGDVALAKTALANQTKQSRSWLAAWDCTLLADASALKTAVDGYETINERYVQVKASLRDRLPVATLSHVAAAMTGSPNITFAEVGGTGDTITRASGSFLTDGFTSGDTIRVTGAVVTGGANNVTCVPAVFAAGVLTLGSTDLVDEGPIAGVSITSEPTLTFALNSSSPDTITRNRGSWLDDGFRVGDIVTISGTSGGTNDKTGTITVLTATVMTFATGTLGADETIGSCSVTMTAGESDTVAISTLDAAFATITSDRRVELGYGRGAMTSPVLGYALRRNVNWVDSVLSYCRDIRTTTWWKALGPVDATGRCTAGFSLLDADGQTYEHDERNTAGALAARFTCARTWGNGPDGTFIARSLTRAGDGSVLEHSHNSAIANLFQTVVQATTENFAGQTLVLEPADNTGKRVATTTSLKDFEDKVNGELSRYLLGNLGGEGPRASVAYWTAATDDDLGGSDATLHGIGTLELNGTIVHISTTVNVK